MAILTFVPHGFPHFLLENAEVSILAHATTTFTPNSSLTIIITFNVVTCAA